MDHAFEFNFENEIMLNLLSESFVIYNNLTKLKRIISLIIQ